MHIFKGKSADDVWCKASARFRVAGATSFSDSRAGGTQELIHAALTISDPKNRWVLSRQPAINPAFALAEVVWILRGCRDTGFLTSFNSSLPNYVGNERFQHGAYGHRLRAKFSIDQLDRAYHVLRRNPHSRQVVLQIWSVEDDFPDLRGKPVAPDIPCNISSMLKVRNGHLLWTQIMRSNDLHRGTPYNLIQFTTLHEVVAGWLGLKMGDYLLIADSLHMYEADIRDQGKIIKAREVPNPDSLALPKAKSEIAWKQLEFFTRSVISKSCRPQRMLKLLKCLDLPIAYRNIARVLAAEAARRKKFAQLPEEMMNGCTNPILQKAWQNWALRVAGK